VGKVISLLSRPLCGLKPTVIALLVAVCTLGCESAHMSYHTVSFNEALEDSDTKVILLNAVRASKRYPMSFSATGTVLGSGAAKANLDTNFPFTVVDGVPRLPSFAVAPKVQVDSAFSSLSATNLETEKFLNALNDPVVGKLLPDYIDRGWPEELIVLAFIREVQLTTTTLRDIQGFHRRICYHTGPLSSGFAPLPAYDRICRSLEEIKERFDSIGCSPGTGRDRRGGFFSLSDKIYKREFGKGKQAKPHTLIRFVNNPRDECELLAFLSVVRRYKLIRARFGTSRTDPSFVAKKRIEYFQERGKRKPTVRDVKEEYEGKAGTEELLFTINNPQTGKLSSFKFGNQKNSVGLIFLRSPYDMIGYVGDLISAQLRHKNPYVPQILVGADQEKADLFRIETGLVDTLSSAVSVQHEGKVYSVPRPGVGEITEHRSLQMLGLIKRFVAKGIEREDLPKSPQVVVGGG
jgi:hypothetical protein